MAGLTFRAFRSLLEREGYQEGEIRHLFSAVRSMDRETRRWVIRWIATGELPRDQVEGVNARYLIEVCGYKPMNAFVILDWLKADPQAAKYFVLRQSPDRPEETLPGEEMEKFLLSQGVEPTSLDGPFNGEGIPEG